MTEKKQKLLQTQGILEGKKPGEPTPRPSGGFIQTGKPKGMESVNYIGKYGTPEEISELVKKIEARRAKLPEFVYLVCPKCGRRDKFPYGDRDIRPATPDYCLTCNPAYLEKTNEMREMTKKEIEQYEKDAEAALKKQIERATKSALYARNQKRQEAGLEPLTMEQFREEEERNYRQSIQRSRGVQK